MLVRTLPFPEAELVGGTAAVEEDEGGGTGGDDAEFLEVLEVAEFALTAGGEDGVGSLWADAGNAEELGTAGFVDFEGGLAEVGARPGGFGVEFEGEVAVRGEGEFFEVEAVLAEEEGGLVEAVFAPGVFGGVFFEGGVADGVEGGEVGAAEADVLVEVVGGGEDFEVTFADGTDDKLGDGGGPAAVPGVAGWLVAAVFFDPLEGAEEFFEEDFLGGELVEAFGV